MRHIILLIILAGVLMGCTPVGRAKARRIDAETWRANSKTSRINERHDLYMRRENALTPVKIEAKANIIWTGQWAVIVVIVALSGAVGWWSIGIARADVKRKNFQATLIPPDPLTHQYPAFIHETKGRHYLVTPNLIGGVIPLDKVLRHDPALADNDTRVKIAGLLSDPHAVAKIIDG